MRHPVIFLAVLLYARLASATDQSWQPLFNGRDLTGWDTEMMVPPDSSWDVPGLQRDTNGVYLEPVGKNRDPLHVFTVTNLDGQPTLHISGQGFGVMMTTATFTNIHLHLEIKWGNRKWGAKLNKPFDTGLLYFCHSEAGVAPSDNHKTWPRSIEFQINQQEFGDLYAICSQVTVAARQDGKVWRYDPAGTNVIFVQKPPINNHCAHMIDPEKPKGEWNSINLYTFNGDSLHVVNGQVVMRLHDARRLDGDAPAPLTSGKICLQTEGGECYYRNVEAQSISELPPELMSP